MATPSVMTEAKSYGKRAVATTSWLPAFALVVARAVIVGEVDSDDDAESVYLAYYDATIKRSGAQTLGSHKAQVSKLRQIMKLADERPRHAVKLLSRVTELHGEMLGREPVVALYAAMVTAARRQLESSTLLTDSEMRKLIARK